ncbi:cytochrome P450 [Sphingomonas bacterium]|uniref:cytochrome P450 n=1 Tax=Sphingomonas bacterium TaxID=1895847 RepID=UPI0026120D3A|nr:cytochrome P450 [Sphingomonas bacterium]MDB5679403.1 cytochrome [Sphingomonas bacterium]
MSTAPAQILEDAKSIAYATPIDQIDPAQAKLFQDNEMWWNFERLRKEDPVHLAESPLYGPYWSITKFNDIMAVDTDHHNFSSEPGITLVTLTDQASPLLPGLSSFISMDPPRHDVQRKTVSPAVSPTNLQILEPLIRERAAAILDRLPIGEEFEWVENVSRELTAMTLATLFGMPQEDRRRLTYWSDVVTAVPGHGVVETREEKIGIFMEYRDYFMKLWNARVNEEPTGDLISMLAHGAETRNMTPEEYFGNVILLTVGGNDTTRNTITGSVYALDRNPDQYAKLVANPSLIPSMVSETIRWQTPLAYMKRRATRDVEFLGKTIREGDTVAMWYVSGNRDDEVIDRPNDYIIDRARPRQHMSFGFGVHRCVGNRLAELQLKVIWEEMMKRFPEINVVGEPKRTFSTFVKGYESMQVVIPRRH